jgi:AraC-like DNA-binding protein
MAPSDPADSISMGSVRAVVAALQGLGADVPSILRRAEIDPGQLSEPVDRIDSMRMNALWLAAEEVTGEAHIGLDVAVRIAPGALGAFEYLIRNTITLRQVIERADRFMRVVDDQARATLVEQGPRAWFRLWRQGGLVWTRHDLECLFAVLVAVARGMFPAARLTVSLTRGSVAPLERYVAAFGVLPTFQAEHDQIGFSSDYLDRPIGSADPVLGEVLEAHVSQLMTRLPEAQLPSRARWAIREQLPRGQASLEAVARTLRMSARTLRRPLEDEATSFRDLVGEVRRELSEHYVAESERPLKEVSELLGFTDQSTFQRAFKRWHGVTPAEFRRRQGPGGRRR